MVDFTASYFKIVVVTNEWMENSRKTDSVDFAMRLNFFTFLIVF